MFSKYDEISKLIRSYIEASLSKPAIDVSILNNHIVQRYGISLSNIDLTDLTNKISSVKKLRNDYEIKSKNSFKQDENIVLELKNEETYVLEQEGRVREFAYILANKLCIMIYKGPLTIDTMKELKEHGYNGTYGNTTMMQMYALYNEKQRLESENEKQKAIISQKDTQIEAFRGQYTEQFYRLQEFKTKNESLMNENNNLKVSQEKLQQNLTNQGLVLQSLNQNIEALKENNIVQLNKPVELTKTIA
jgi:hypothetical protein